MLIPALRSALASTEPHFFPRFKGQGLEYRRLLLLDMRRKLTSKTGRGRQVVGAWRWNVHAS